MKHILQLNLYQDFPFNWYYIKNLIFVYASLVMQHIILSQDPKTNKLFFGYLWK